MDFEFSPKVKDLQKRVTAFMEEHIYPNEAKYQEHCDGPESMAARSRDRRVEAEGTRRRAVESFSARERTWRGINEPGIRSAVRDHGPLAHRSGSVQLFGAGYREHGSAGTLRFA